MVAGAARSHCFWVEPEPFFGPAPAPATAPTPTPTPMRRSKNRSRNLSGAGAGAENFKNGRLRQP